ncbi:MAG: hypothetical protein ACLPSW_35970 [Roseiarcus sp.]
MSDERNVGELLDKTLAVVDGLCKRLDAIEKAGADYDKRNRADARKRAKTDAAAAIPRGKDAPQSSDEDPYRDPSKPRQTAADDNTGTANMSEDDLPTKILRAKALRDELYALEGEVKRDMRVQGPLCEAEAEQMADAQARADSAYSALGKRCPGPMPGERLAQYHARILNPLKRYSETWRDVKIENFAGKNLEKIESDIIADAQTFADSAENVPNGDELVPVQKSDDSGRMITTFRGRRSFVNQFKGPAMRATIRDPREHRLREILAREQI